MSDFNYDEALNILSISAVALDTVATVNTIFTIINRTINIPLHTLMTIEGDSNSRIIQFDFNRYYDGIDLSTKDIRIKYQNALLQYGYSNIIEAAITETNLIFNWIIPGEVSASVGIVTIQVDFFDLVGETTIYRWQTLSTNFGVERTLGVGSNAETVDYTYQIQFYSTNNNLTVLSDMQTLDIPITISNRDINIPTTMNINVVEEDTRSRLIPFIMPRFYDGVDISTKIICIKFRNSVGTGDRSRVYNMTVDSDTVTFNWLLLDHATSVPGTLDFAIEVIGFNSNETFYLLQTKSAQLNVLENLKVDGTIDHPIPSWYQSFQIEADAKIVELENLIANGSDVINYTTPSPIPQAIGGISVGKTYTAAPITQVLNDLLYPYLSPQVSLTASVSGGIREYGSNITSLGLTATTTKRTNPITSLIFYRDGNLINTVSIPNANGESKLFTETTVINNSCSFTSIVSDGTQAITSNSVGYSFVYPIYIGSVTSDILTEAILKSMTKRVVSKANQSLSYTISNAKFCFAYPTSYGVSLSSIKDTNNFELIDTFNKQTINMTMLNGAVINYTVYTSATTSQTAFTVTYIF